MFEVLITDVHLKKNIIRNWTIFHNSVIVQHSSRKCVYNTNISCNPSPNISCNPSPNISCNPSPNISCNPSPNFSCNPSPNFSCNPSPNFSCNPSLHHPWQLVMENWFCSSSKHRARGFEPPFFLLYPSLNFLCFQVSTHNLKTFRGINHLSTVAHGDITNVSPIRSMAIHRAIPP